jgi:hypothetical protein
MCFNEKKEDPEIQGLEEVVPSRLMILAWSCRGGAATPFGLLPGKLGKVTQLSAFAVVRKTLSKRKRLIVR